MALSLPPGAARNIRPAQAGPQIRRPSSRPLPNGRKHAARAQKRARSRLQTRCLAHASPRTGRIPGGLQRSYAQLPAPSQRSLHQAPKRPSATQLASLPLLACSPPRPAPQSPPSNPSVPCNRPRHKLPRPPQMLVAYAHGIIHRQHNPLSPLKRPPAPLRRSSLAPPL